MSHAAAGNVPPWQDRELLARLNPMLELLETSHVSLSSVTDPDEARNVHVADSVSGLACPEVREAASALDLGSGGGFPGVPLALALPDCNFTLIDSVGRKVEFVNQAISALELKNAHAVKSRSEDWARTEGFERYDLVTARAVAPLSVLAELASPLLREGGHLVAWKGDPEPDSEAVIADNHEKLAMTIDRQEIITPYEGSREKRLYVLTKDGPTPEGLPRRAGIARKRPLSRN